MGTISNIFWTYKENFLLMYIFLFYFQVPAYYVFDTSLKICSIKIVVLENGTIVT